MSNILGVSNDDKYIFTNKGFYVCENEGFYIPYNEGMLPFLVQMVKDNADFELKKGKISLKEYSSIPRKLLYQLSEIFQSGKQFKLIKEWEENFGKKTLINESFNPAQIKKSISESFDGLRKLISEQNINSLATEISSKIIDALSKTFNDDEEEALKQIKRINSKELLDLVSNNIKVRKKMDLKTYLNSEMSDVDWEYKSIYNHLKSLDASMASGYKENKFLQGAGKIVDAGAKVGGVVLKGLSAATKAIILPLLKKGIIPLLRWVRRNAYTSIGMVIDIVTAMIPVTTGINKIAWILIVMLDLYEIIVGDFDPEDDERNQNPYMFLVIDLIAALFSSAAGSAAKAGLKGGAKAMSSSTSKVLKSLLEKLPGLKNMLKGWGEFLAKKIPALNSIIRKIFGGIDRIILGIETFIKQLFSKKGLMAVATGAAIAWFFKERELSVGDSGNDVLAVNQYFSTKHNDMWPDCSVPQDVVNNLKNDGNKFTENTEIAVKTFEGCLIKKYPKVIKQVDGKITNQELACMVKVEMDDRGMLKHIIPLETRENFNKTMESIMSFLAKGAEKTLKPLSN
jgi:hypothetical protein